MAAIISNSGFIESQALQRRDQAPANPNNSTDNPITSTATAALIQANTTSPNTPNLQTRRIQAIPHVDAFDDATTGAYATSDLAVMLDSSNIITAGEDHSSVYDIAPNTVQVVSNCVNAYTAYKNAEAAYSHGDKSSLGESLLEIAKAPFEAITGAACAAVDGINSASNITTPMDKAAGILGLISVAGSSTAAVIYTVAATVRLGQTISIVSSLKPLLQDTDTLEKKKTVFNALQNKLFITDEDKREIFNQISQNKKEPWYKKRTSDILVEQLFGNNKDKKKLLKKLLENPNDALLEEFLQSDPPLDLQSHLKLSRDEIPAFEIPEGALSVSSKENFKIIKALLYQTALNTETARKKAAFTNTLGKDVEEEVEKLTEESKIPGFDISTKQASLEKIISCGKKQLNQTIFKSILYALSAAFGLVAVVLLQISTSGVFTFVEMGISLVTCAIGVGINALRLYRLYTDHTVNKKDLLLAATATIFVAIATVIGAVLTKGILNFWGSVGITIAWAFVALYSIYAWNRTSSTKKTETPQEPRPNTPPVFTDSGFIEGSEEDSNALMAQFIRELEEFDLPAPPAPSPISSGILSPESTQGEAPTSHAILHRIHSVTAPHLNGINQLRPFSAPPTLSTSRPVAIDPLSSIDPEVSSLSEASDSFFTPIESRSTSSPQNGAQRMDAVTESIANSMIHRILNEVAS